MPESEFMEAVTLQETLRNMIRDGTIKSKDDHALVMEIMKADFGNYTSDVTNTFVRTSYTTPLGP